MRYVPSRSNEIPYLLTIKSVVLKLNYCKKVFFFLIHLFAGDVLVMKKWEIKTTKPTFKS